MIDLLGISYLLPYFTSIDLRLWSIQYMQMKNTYCHIIVERDFFKSLSELYFEQKEIYNLIQRIMGKGDFLQENTTWLAKN